MINDFQYNSQDYINYSPSFEHEHVSKKCNRCCFVSLSSSDILCGKERDAFTASAFNSCEPQTNSFAKSRGLVTTSFTTPKIQVLFSSALERLSLCLIWCGASATLTLVYCSSFAIIADDKWYKVIFNIRECPVKLTTFSW